jgi:dTDP-4-amino-4,6-dideoxygalactose transaminase
MIRLTIPSIDEHDLEAVRASLSTGRLVQGAHVAAFEERLRAFTGTRHVIAVSSGTAALHVSLLALGIGPGDLVAVTAYSWPATANAIELCGGRPVFVDIEDVAFNLDPDDLARKVRSVSEAGGADGSLKAVLPVHAFGHVADMPRICRVASDHGLAVLEDAACALGAVLEDRPAGSWGRMAAFSLHPRKAITTGEGGAIATDDDQLAWKARTLRNHGLDADSATPDFVMPGFNYRMTEFQAALGASQLEKLPRILERRRALAHRYNRLLAGSPITPPEVPQSARAIHQSYVCLLPQDGARQRSGLIAALRDRGVETTIGTWHVPMTSYFRNRYGFRTGDFPVTDRVDARALTLPLYESMTDDDQDRVVDALLDQVH